MSHPVIISPSDRGRPRAATLYGVYSTVPETYLKAEAVEHAQCSSLDNAGDSLSSLPGWSPEADSDLRGRALQLSLGSSRRGSGPLSGR